METTVIKLSKKTCTLLKKMKVHPRQSYDEVIVKLIKLNEVMENAN